jgi:hypothetical protein
MSETASNRQRKNTTQEQKQLTVSLYCGCFGFGFMAVIWEYLIR